MRKMLFLESFQKRNQNKKSKILPQINFSFTNGHFQSKFIFRDIYLLWPLGLFIIPVFKIQLIYNTNDSLLKDKNLILSLCTLES